MPFLQPVCPKPHFVQLIVQKGKDRIFHIKTISDQKTEFLTFRSLASRPATCSCCSDLASSSAVFPSCWRKTVSVFPAREAVCSIHWFCCQRQKQGLTGLRNKKGGHSPRFFLFLYSPYFISLLVLQGGKVRIRKKTCALVSGSPSVRCLRPTGFPHTWYLVGGRMTPDAEPPSKKADDADFHRCQSPAGAS